MGDPLTKCVLHLLNISVRYINRLIQVKWSLESKLKIEEIYGNVDSFAGIVDLNDFCHKVNYLIAYRSIERLAKGQVKES